MAHDETNSLGLGDIVRIEACRPISRTKKFAVAEVLIKSKFNAQGGPAVPIATTTAATEPVQD